MEFDDSGYDAFSSTNAGAQDLRSCGNCGRTFNPQVLAKHEPICSKTTQKQRKVFNSSKQRAEGTEINSVKPSRATQKAAPRQQIQPKKKNNWRQKHEEFISAIRNARGVQEAIDSGKPLPPPPPPTINPDYIQCPHCSRRFAESAAERHMNFCKEQAARKPRTVTNNQSSGAAKQQARLGYKAPRVGGAAKKAPPSSTGSYGGGGGGGGGGYQAGGKPPAGRSATSRVPLQSTKSAGNATQQRTPARGQNNGMSRTTGGYGDRYEADNASPASGRALRTGRTAEMYSDARELSAKQRQGMPKSPHDDPKFGYNGTSPSNSARRPGSGTRATRDTGYYSSSDESRGGSGRMAVTGTGRAGSGIAKFCHECGTKYPVPHAKFCCECGIKRVMIA